MQTGGGVLQEAKGLVSAQRGLPPRPSDPSPCATSSQGGFTSSFPVLTVFFLGSNCSGWGSNELVVVRVSNLVSFLIFNGHASRSYPFLISL